MFDMDSGDHRLKPSLARALEARTMTNKIEQIIGEGAVSAVDFYGKDLTEHIGQAITRQTA